MFLWGIDFGLPQTFHNDEPQIVERAVDVASGNLSYAWYDWPATIQINALGVIYKTMDLGHQLILGSDLNVEQWAASNPSLFYIIARLMTVAFALGAVIIVFLIGKEIESKPFGLVAAFILTLGYSFGRHAHFAVPDMILTFFIILAIYFSLLAYRKKGLLFFILAGAAVGFATAAKYPGILAAGSMVVVYVLLLFSGQEKKLRKFTGYAALCLLVAIIAFTLVSPFFWFDLDQVWSDISKVSDTSHVGRTDTSLLDRANFYLQGAIPQGVGWLIMILAGCGVIYCLWMKKKELWIILGFVVLYFIFLGTFESKWERYILPLVPIVIIFAVYFVWEAVHLAWGKMKIFPLVLTILIILIGSLPSLCRLIMSNEMMAGTKNDTRVRALEWAMENLPQGTVIGQENQTPQFPENYFLTETNQYLANHPMEYYQDNNFEYLIASNEMYRRFFNSEGNEEEEAFYNELFAGEEVYKAGARAGDVESKILSGDLEVVGWFFSNTDKVFNVQPGPTVRIFRVPS